MKGIVQAEAKGGQPVFVAPADKHTAAAAAKQPVEQIPKNIATAGKKRRNRKARHDGLPVQPVDRVLKQASAPRADPVEDDQSPPPTSVSDAISAFKTSMQNLADVLAQTKQVTKGDEKEAGAAAVEDVEIDLISDEDVYNDNLKLLGEDEAQGTHKGLRADGSIHARIRAGLDFCMAPTLPSLRLHEKQGENGQVHVDIPSFEVAYNFIAAGSDVCDLQHRFALKKDEPIGPHNPLVIPLSDAALKRAIESHTFAHPKQRHIPSQLISCVALMQINISKASQQSIGTHTVLTPAAVVPTPLYLLTELFSAKKGSDVREETILRDILTTFFPTRASGILADKRAFNARKASEKHLHSDRRPELVKLGLQFLDGQRKEILKGIQTVTSKAELDVLLTQAVIIDSHIAEAKRQTKRGKRAARKGKKQQQQQAPDAVAAPAGRAAGDAAVAIRTSSDVGGVAASPANNQQVAASLSDDDDEDDEDDDEDVSQQNKRKNYANESLLASVNGVMKNYYAYDRMRMLADRYQYDKQLDLNAVLTSVDQFGVLSLQVFANDQQLQPIIGSGLDSSSGVPQIRRGGNVAAALAAMGHAIHSRHSDVVQLPNVVAPGMSMGDKTMFTNDHMRTLAISNVSEHMQSWIYMNPTLELGLALIEAIHPALTLKQWLSEEPSQRMLFFDMPAIYGPEYYPSGRFPTPGGAIAALSIADRASKVVAKVRDGMAAEVAKADLHADILIQQARERKSPDDVQSKQTPGDVLDKLTDSELEKVLEAEVKKAALSNPELSVDVDHLNSITAEEAKRYAKLSGTGSAADMKRAVKNRLKMSYTDFLTRCKDISQVIRSEDTVINLRNEKSIFLLAHPIVDVKPSACCGGGSAFVEGGIRMRLDVAN